MANAGRRNSRRRTPGADENTGSLFDYEDGISSASGSPRQLKKAVEAIHISSKIGLRAKKLLNNLVFHAFDTLDKEVEHRISLSQMASDIGFNSKNTAELKASIMELIEGSVQFNILKNGSGEQWRASSMLADADIENGILTYSFSPTARRLWKNPKVFALIDLHITKRITSNFAFALYENCLRFKNIGTTGFIAVEIWRQLLGADKQSYDKFKEFNKHVIKKATEEVNRETDIIISPEFKRLSKKVTEIKFHIEMKTASQLALSIRDSDALKVQALQKLEFLGITARAAKLLVNEHPLDYLLGNIEEIERRVAAGVEIKSIPGLLHDALKKDYRKIVPKVIQEKEQAAIEKKKKAEEAKALAEAEEERVKNVLSRKLADARQYYAAMGAIEQKQVTELYLAHLNKVEKMVYKQYLKNGMESQLVHKSFEMWLVNSIEAGTI